MKTNQKRKKLLEDAADLLDLIDYARRRRDNIYKVYRECFHICSREYMFKLHHRIEILDMAIDRIKKSYIKKIDELCILK